MTTDPNLSWFLESQEPGDLSGLYPAADRPG
jgi:hypothetical protein